MARKKKERSDHYFDPFPTRLRRLLEERNLSHQEFGDFLGVARQSVGNYCNGTVQPSIETIIKTAEYFQVSSDYLLGISDVRTTDASITTACKVTGLDEETITILYRNFIGEENRENRIWVQDIICIPLFEGIINTLHSAWEAGQKYQQWDTPRKSTQEEKDKLNSAVEQVKASGLAVQTWNEIAEERMSRALQLLNILLDTVVGLWHSPYSGDDYDGDEDDS